MALQSRNWQRVWGGGGRQRQCLKLVFPAELRLSQTQVRLESKSDSSRLEFSERYNSAQLTKTTASEAGLLVINVGLEPGVTQT